MQSIILVVGQNKERRNEMSKKVNLKTHKWIKAPFNKGYVLVSKEYLKQFKKKGETR